MEMDAVTAHLDRGWDLLNRGELGAARLSADHILRIDGESPEGHTLLGAIVAAEGDAEEAMELFRRAMDMDPEYLDAVLYAIELAIHPLEDFDVALKLCDQAADLAADDIEALDVQLLRAEAWLGAGALDEARRAAGGLPPPPFPDPAYYLRAGRVLLEVELRSRAIELLEEAARHEATRSDGHYFLGVALELEDRPKDALEHFLTVHTLDQTQPGGAGDLPAGQLDEVMRQVVAEMPEPLGSLLRGAPWRVLDYPAVELVAEGFDPRAAVLLTGIPADEPPAGGARRRRTAARRRARLNCTFIYRRNVARFARAGGDVPAEIHRLLVQEAGYFFALDEVELRRLLDARA
ncbi:MAG: tetratricopeptide repeat protein [Deltaproteobacteria bacterium]|nr:tetratricopeptide repeat protein [Deltaproteobacteria bacterium]